MRNFKTAFFVLAVSVFASRARAQQAQGYALERLYRSAPGGGWTVMDTLDMHGRLGGAMSLSLGYARDPFRIPFGAVVSDQAAADFGMAVTYERFRFYLNLDAPIAVSGQSGVTQTYAYTAPSLTLGSHPDTLSDARIGFDMRVLGDYQSAFRLGLGGQLYVPNGERVDYVTDDTYRAMFRVLFAGDIGRFTYAAHVGVHIRPLDDSPIVGSPQGSELLFGLAAGPRFSFGHEAIVVGPEVFGESAFRSFFGENTTGVEGLFSGRFEHAIHSNMLLRAKIGAGVGLHPEFGAPLWRGIVSIEVVGNQ